MPDSIADATPAPLPADVRMRWLQQAGAQALLRLHLRPHACLLRIESGAQTAPAPPIQLPLGLQILSEQVFAGRMPNEAQLEHGIMLVEEAIMPVAAQLPAHRMLLLDDPVLREVGARALGSTRATTRSLRREAVETLFHLLAMQAAHPSVPHPDVPQTPQAAAALLILREVLHHWQLESVLLDDQPSG